MWEYNYPTELCHHGILGQKWGVRRYQNKYGALTPAGKKHRAKLESQYDEMSKIGKLTDAGKKKKASIESEYKQLTGKSVRTRKSDTATEQAKKTSLSDDELRAKVNRMQLEKQSLELEKQISALNPKKVSAGEKFAKSLANDVIGPAAKNAGKIYLEKMLKDKLGLNEEKPKSEYQKLKDEFDLSKLKKDLSDLNKEPSDYDKRKKEYDAAKLEKDFADLNSSDPFKDMRTAVNNYNAKKKYDEAVKEWAANEKARQEAEEIIRRYRNTSSQKLLG